LTALVAQRQIDFVTSKGDRINQRSLDLKIIWDDIVGIARPAGAAFSAKRLARWAALVSGDPNIKSLDDEKSKAALQAALHSWYGDWVKGRVLRRFNELPDDVLNASIWSIASRCSKMLGATAEIVKAAIEHSISLEECINRIAGTFSDSEEQFQRAQSELVVIDSFIKGAPMRAEILSYLSGCEVTDVDELEEMREELYHLIDVSYRNPSDASNRELSYLWIKYRRDFADHFAAKHDAVMRSHSLQASYNEIVRSDDWWEFENLSRIPMLHSSRTLEVAHLSRRLSEVDCRYEVRDALEARPFCQCSFGLSDEAHWEELPQQLEAAIARAVRSYRETLLKEKESVLPLLANVERKSGDSGAATAATALIEAIGLGEELPRFSSIQLQVLQRALADHPHPSDVLVDIMGVGEELVAG